MKILVTDGDERASLAVVRSLGRAGHHVDVASKVDRSLAGASRFAQQELQVPDPLRTPDEFVDVVRRLTLRGGIELLIPVTEASLHAVLPQRDTFADVTIPFALYDSFQAVCDKGRVHKAATELGIPVPKQVQIQNPDQAARAAEELRFPLVVKASRSVVPGDIEASHTSIQFVDVRDELPMALEAMPPTAYPVLAQERVDGAGKGAFVLLWGGDLIAAFCHRRIREKPPSGGVSVLRESVGLDQDLIANSRRLLERFAWQGVAMVEYKEDRRTGTPYLMEVNGRFWGSLQLAIDAGVDFPRLLIDAATGSIPDPVLEYETGVRTRWLLGDVDHLLLRLRNYRHRAKGISNPRGRDSAVKDFVTSFGSSSRNEVFRWADPWPGVRELRQWGAELWPSSWSRRQTSS